MVIALHHSLISNLHDQQSRFITHERCMLENPLDGREEKGVRLIYITIHATSIVIMKTIRIHRVLQEFLFNYLTIIF